MKGFRPYIMHLTFAAALITLAIASTAYYYQTQYKNKPNQENNTRIEGKNIILIGWDGTDEKTLKNLLDQGRLPNLKQLTTNGTLITLTIKSGNTDTAAGWTEILTGYHPYRTGVYANGLIRELPEGYTIHERLEKQFGDENIETIFIAGKIRHVVWPFSSVAYRMDVFRVGLANASNVGSVALDLLEENRDKRFFAFIHFREPDVQGHGFCGGAAEYAPAIVADDFWLGRIVNKLKKLGIYDETLVYVVTDHGFNVTGVEHDDEPYIFLATNDPTIVNVDGKGDVWSYRDRSDIAPTILEKFGIDTDNINPPLDGATLTKNINTTEKYAKLKSALEYNESRIRDCWWYEKRADPFNCTAQIYGVKREDVKRPLYMGKNMPAGNEILWTIEEPDSIKYAEYRRRVVDAAVNNSFLFLCDNLESKDRMDCTKKVIASRSLNAGSG